jgi:hypothetical protein
MKIFIISQQNIYLAVYSPVLSSLGHNNQYNKQNQNEGGNMLRWVGGGFYSKGNKQEKRLKMVG